MVAQHKKTTLLTKGLWVISVCTVCFLFIANIIFNVSVSLDRKENATIQNNVVWGIIMLAAAVVLILICGFLKNYIEKINPKWLFSVFAILYLILAVYLICNIDFTLRADAQYISEAAKNLLNGDLTDFKTGGYLNNYPHQTGLVLYTAFLYLFTQNTAIQFAANLIFVLGTNYFIYKITDVLFRDRFVNILTVFLSFGFLPQFFFIVFAYGNIPSFFFLTLAFYFTLKFVENRNWVAVLIVVLSGSMAVFLRKNCIIGVIAIIIFLLLKLRKKDLLKHSVLIILLLLGSIFPQKLSSSYFLEKAEVEKAGAPNVLWIAMGTDIDNTERGPGWYNGFNRVTFLKAKSDPDTAQKKAIEKLNDNIDKIKQEPVRAIKFFTKKVISQWCEPTYQSIWSGPLEDCGQQIYTKPLKSIYNGGEANDIISVVMKGYMIALWGLLALYLIKKGLKQTGWELFVLYLIGGFLFHVFWEAKSQYVYQYAVTIIPFSAFALSRCAQKIEEKLQK